MTTIVEALNRIARQCSVKAPSSWVTATRDDHVSLRDDFLSETIRDIHDRVDLPSPIGKQQTITGDGSTAYTLNSDFLRMQRDENAVYDTALDRPVIPVTTDGGWTRITDLGTAGATRYYKLTGYEGNYSISFHQAPSASVGITVSYVSNLWKATSGGTAGSEFTDEADILLLPRKVVETGTIWRYRRRNGMLYEDVYTEYEALMSRLINDTRQRKIISFSEPDRRVRWQDLIPAYIPDS